MSYLGISVPIGQGLIIDERRAAIRQAQQLSNLAEAERISLINKLLLQAGKDYLDWMVAYNKWRLLEQGQQLALVRFEGIKQRALQGDVPSIDTVEAIIAVQNLQVMASQALVEYKNSSLVVSNFLWTENNTPLEITNEAVPSLTGNENVITESSSLERLIQQAQTNHPELVKIRVKLSQLNIERRFLVDKFKPKINLEYNMIQKGFPIAEEAFIVRTYLIIINLA
jgi:outer membrane protein TolC